MKYKMNKKMISLFIFCILFLLGMGLTEYRVASADEPAEEDEEQICQVQVLLPDVRVEYRGIEDPSRIKVYLNDEELTPAGEVQSWSEQKNKKYWILVDCSYVKEDEDLSEELSNRINKLRDMIGEGDSFSIYLTSDQAAICKYDSSSEGSFNLSEYLEQEPEEYALILSLLSIVDQVEKQERKNGSYNSHYENENAYFTDDNNVIAVITDGKDIDSADYKKHNEIENIPGAKAVVDHNIPINWICDEHTKGNETGQPFDLLVRETKGKVVELNDLPLFLEDVRYAIYRYSTDNLNYGSIRVSVDEEIKYQKKWDEFPYIKDYVFPDEKGEEEGSEEIKEAEKDEEAVGPEEDTGTSEEADAEKTEQSFLWEYFPLLLGGFLFIIVLITILILVARANRKKAEIRRSQREKETKPQPREERMPAKGVPFRLEIGSTDGSREIKEARINKTAIVGRASICDIRISHDTISRQHFIIEYRDKNFYIQDLSSGNGTYLNGVKLTHIRRIEKGDKIRIGDIDITVRW